MPLFPEDETTDEKIPPKTAVQISKTFFGESVTDGLLRHLENEITQGNDVFYPSPNKAPELTDDDQDLDRIRFEDEPARKSPVNQISNAIETAAETATQTVVKAKRKSWRLFGWIAGIGCFLFLCLIALIVVCAGGYYIYSGMVEASRIAEQQAAEVAAQIEAAEKAAEEARKPPAQLNTNRNNEAEFMVVNQANGWANICRDVYNKIESDQITDGRGLIREWGTQSKAVTDTSYAKMMDRMKAVNQSEWRKEDMKAMILDWERGFRKPLK
jgi:uncharacterized protein (UPF0333 family)